MKMPVKKLTVSTRVNSRLLFAFIQDIEDMCLLLTSSMSFIDLPFQEHQMTEKHQMDQNPSISYTCSK
jgi:ABC-type polysaccharide/polyol phosphate transport system ATPase subunit